MFRSISVKIIVFSFLTTMTIIPQTDNNSHWEGIPGLDGTVDIIRIMGDDLIVGGTFDAAGSDSNAAHIAKWNGSEWEAFGSGLNDWCTSIAIDGEEIYVGGSFTKAGETDNTSFIAKWNGSDWEAVGTGLNLHVNDLELHNGELYAGGIFRNAGGNPDADRIAKWNGQNWIALDKGLDGWVYTIAFHGDELYAGGAFTSANADTNIKYIAKWNGVDSVWESFGNGLNNWVHHIGFNGDEMYIGGFFTDAGGDPTADHIAKWNGTGWEGLGEGLNGDFSEVEEFIFDGEDIYVAGQFSTVGADNTFNNFAKWNGSSWEKFGFGLDQETRSLVILNNDLYVGGSFSAEGPGGIPDVHHFARWRDISSTTDIDDNSLPKDFKLYQNYPNPFNPSTKIKFTIPAVSPLYQRGDKGGLVTLKVFDILGNEVATLVNEGKPAGTYEIEFNASNLSSGIYFYRLQADGLSLIKKLMLMK